MNYLMGIIIEYPANLDFVFLHENKVTNSSMKPYPAPYSNPNMIGDEEIFLDDFQVHFTYLA